MNQIFVNRRGLFGLIGKILTLIIVLLILGGAFFFFDLKDKYYDPIFGDDDVEDFAPENPDELEVIDAEEISNPATNEENMEQPMYNEQS